MKAEMKQTDLLGKPNRRGADGDEAVVVLSSNFSLPKLLERGCLLPPVFGEREDCDFLRDWREEIPHLEGVLARNWSDGVEKSGRNMYPIGIRLKTDRSLGTVEVDTRERFPTLLIEDVQEIVFRNDDELSTFRDWRFEEFDIESLDMKFIVDPSVFDGEESTTTRRDSDLVDSDESDVPEREIGLRDVFRRADMAAGLLAVYAREVPATPYWLERFSALSSGIVEPSAGEHHIPTDLFGELIRPGEVRHSDLDGLLIGHSIDVLTKYPVQAGWPATAILEKIYGSTWTSLEELKEDRWSGELSAWYEHSKAVLEGEKEIKELTDDGSVVRRALLLLLLRGDMKSIEESIDRTKRSESTVEVGTDVGTLALSLAGCRQGLRSLDSTYKTNFHGDDPIRWMEYLGRYFLERIKTEQSGSKKKKKRKGAQQAITPAFDVSYRKVATLQGEWAFTVDGASILRRPARFDEGLLRLLHLGTDLGYVFDEYEDDKLETEISLDTGERQRVVVELLSDRPELREVRFWAIVRPLKFGKSSEPTPKAGVFRRVGKELLLQLLLRSGEDNMNCGFAISAKRGGIIVKADQPFSTLDELEFEKRLVQVATIANEILTPKSKNVA